MLQSWDFSTKVYKFNSEINLIIFLFLLNPSVINFSSQIRFSKCFTALRIISDQIKFRNSFFINFTSYVNNINSQIRSDRCFTDLRIISDQINFRNSFFLLIPQVIQPSVNSLIQKFVFLHVSQILNVFLIKIESQIRFS